MTLITAYYSLRGIPATEAPWIQLVLDGTPDGIGFALVVLGLWRGEGAFGIKLLTLAPLVYLGEISYGLYVYHVLVLNGPIGVAMHGFLGSENIGAWTPWLVDLPITVGIATFSWWLVEQPILRLKERFAYRYG